MVRGATPGRNSLKMPLAVLAVCLATLPLVAQGSAPASAAPAGTMETLFQAVPSESPSSEPAPPMPPSDAVVLYRELRSVGLDPGKVFHIRDAMLAREDLHIYLNDGLVAFTQAVDGRITGCLFEGDGQELLRPPNLGERASLGLFTGLGILDQTFTRAYLRGTEDLYEELAPFLRLPEPEEVGNFVAEHDALAREVAEGDALRLTQSFTSDFPPGSIPRDRFFHAVLITGIGPFSVAYDSMAEDQIVAGRVTTQNGQNFYDLWMAFPARNARATNAPPRVIDPWRSPYSVSVKSTAIQATLQPPEHLEAQVTLQLEVRNGGQRLLVFELSRRLRVEEVILAGEPLAWLQNEAVTGSDLARRGNDLVTVILPGVLHAGEHLELRFRYGGNVMQQAAPGLVYVGERGTWYPNRGIELTNFQLTLHWPAEWALAATGHHGEITNDHGELSATWLSDGPIPYAGFNIGQYHREEARSGEIEIESFAASSVEASLVPPKTGGAVSQPDPSQRALHVAQHAAETIAQYEQWFGPYPFRDLSLTQFPGNMSQGWAGLIFLSTLAFLSPEEKKQLGMDEFTRIVSSDFMVDHEVAHEWWGDLVSWRSYRDQWLSEALANYSAWMRLERTDPASARLVLDEYRRQLLARNAHGSLAEAGPVTHGIRLTSSIYPVGYITVAYGRGTWLIHMMREFFRDDAVAAGESSDPDARFLAALRDFRLRYEHKAASTRDLMTVLEDHLPEFPARSAKASEFYYEDKRSLDWFLQGWVQGTSVPSYQVAELKVATREGRSTASFTLVQQQAPESLVTSVPIYAAAADGTLTFVARAFADGSRTQLRLAVPAGTRKLVVDPFDTVLTAK